MDAGIDYTGISVVFYCHDGNGNFLMGKKGKNCRDENGKWDIGSGEVELYNPVSRTLEKEIKQEYGTRIITAEELGFRDVHRFPNGTRTHWIGLDFKVLVDKNMVRNGEPHKFDAVEWFNFNTLPSEDQLHSQLRIFLRKYRDRL